MLRAQEHLLSDWAGCAGWRRGPEDRTSRAEAVLERYGCGWARTVLKLPGSLPYVYLVRYVVVLVRTDRTELYRAIFALPVVQAFSA